MIKTIPTRDVEHFSQWGDALADNMFPFTVESENPKEFRGLVRSRRFAGIDLIDMRSGPHRAYREGSLIRAHEDAEYVVSLQISGTATVEQDNRTATVKAGDFSFYDSTKPVTITSGPDYRSVALKFPRQRLNMPRDYITQLSATRIGPQDGLAKAVGPLLSHLNISLDGISNEIQVNAVQQTLLLIRSMLQGELNRRGITPSDPDIVLLERISNYVDVNLHDPELRPAQIAAAHFISLRRLYNLYETTGWTITESIRSKRLERCRHDLSDPFQRDTPIVTIAERIGFKTSSHFGQVFKKATGLTPGEFRARTLS